MGEVGSLETPVCAQVCDKESSGRGRQRSLGLVSTPTLPLQENPGNSWDWPLSRNEKQERLRLIDRHVSSLDREALLGEIEHLRTSCDRSSRPSTSVDAR